MDFLILLLLGILIGVWRIPVSEMEMRVYYGEYHANRDGGTAQLFYSENGEGFSEERSLICNMDELNNSVEFMLPDVDLMHTDFRFDPFMNEETFSIQRVEIWCQGKLIWLLYGDMFDSYVEGIENCVYLEDEGQCVGKLYTGADGIGI